MFKKIIVSVVLIIIAILSYRFYRAATEEPSGIVSPNLKQECESQNGIWLSEYQECEYAGKEWCEDAGGKYFECESACRHSQEPLAPCTLQCVMVCKFGGEEISLGKNPLNAVYIIEGKEVTLVNGGSEMEIVPGSASKTITQYFGNNAEGDFNGDNIIDIAFLLTQDSGGSGTFFYVAAALGTEDGYDGTNAIFLGDRIAPQTTEFRNGEIIVNYADRKSGEPMTASPSVGVSKYFKISGGKLVEVQK